MRRRKIKKVTKSQFKQLRGNKWLVCKECEEEEVAVAMDTSAVTCAVCVQKTLAPPPATKKVVKSGMPRGWHFKVYFEKDGVVYSKGKVIKDAKKIASLKKAHPPAKSTKKPAKAVGKTTAKKRGRKNASTTK